MIQRWSHKVSDRRISSEALKIKIAGNGLRKYRKRSALGVFSESSRAGENFDGKTSDITSVTDASHAETATIFFLFRIQWTFVYNPKLHFFSCSFILHFDCFFVSLTAALVVVLFFRLMCNLNKAWPTAERSLWIVWPLASSIHFTPNKASSISVELSFFFVVCTSILIKRFFSVSLPVENDEFQLNYAIRPIVDSSIDQ